MKLSRRKGMTLGAVLMVITLAITVAFALASTSIFHIRMSAHTFDSDQALDMSETTIGIAIDNFANPANPSSPFLWGQSAPYPTLDTYRLTAKSDVQIG